MNGAASVNGAASNDGPVLVVVAHGGPLEAKAALLVASIRTVLPVTQRIRIAVPEPVERWGALSPAMRRLLDALEIATVPTRNRIDDEYPHGNKISAMEGLHEPCVFLDSDMLVVRPFALPAIPGEADAAAKLADGSTYERRGGNWSVAYGMFDLPTPPRDAIASYTGERMHPYYNAGFVAARDGDALARAWADTARGLDANAAVQNKRPWLDQVALPVAFARLGWSVATLDESLNFPGHIRREQAADFAVLHYHDPRVIAFFPQAAAMARDLVARVPGLRAVREPRDVWREMLASESASDASSRPAAAVG